MIYNTDAIMKAFEEGKDFEDIVSAFESAVTEVAKKYNEKKKATDLKMVMIKEKARSLALAAIEFAQVAFPENVVKELEFDTKITDEDIDLLADQIMTGFSDLAPLLSLIVETGKAKESDKDTKTDCCGNCSDCHHDCPNPTFTSETSDKPVNFSPEIKTTFFGSPKTSKEVEDLLNFFFKG